MQTGDTSLEEGTLHLQQQQEQQETAHMAADAVGAALCVGACSMSPLEQTTRDRLLDDVAEASSWAASAPYASHNTDLAAAAAAAAG